MDSEKIVMHGDLGLDPNMQVATLRNWVRSSVVREVLESAKIAKPKVRIHSNR